jgi:hypothetical protein
MMIRGFGHGLPGSSWVCSQINAVAFGWPSMFNINSGSFGWQHSDSQYGSVP